MNHTETKQETDIRRSIDWLASVRSTAIVGLGLKWDARYPPTVL